MRWFSHIERMGYEKFVKKVYLSSVEGTTGRGRPLRRWEDRVKEYVCERGVRGNELELQEGRAWIGKGGDPSAVPTPLVKRRKIFMT